MTCNKFNVNPFRKGYCTNCYKAQSMHQESSVLSPAPSLNTQTTPNKSEEIKKLVTSSGSPVKQRASDLMEKAITSTQQTYQKNIKATESPTMKARVSIFTPEVLNSAPQTRLPTPVSPARNRLSIVKTETPVQNVVVTSPGSENGKANGCKICCRTVYFMEKLEVDGKLYHKTCFKCDQCKKTLSAGTYASVGDKVFCKPHFKSLFKLKGNYDEGFGQTQRKHNWGSASADPSAPLSPSSPSRRKESTINTPGSSPFRSSFSHQYTPRKSLCGPTNPPSSTNGSFNHNTMLFSPQKSLTVNSNTTAMNSPKRGSIIRPATNAGLDATKKTVMTSSSINKVVPPDQTPAAQTSTTKTECKPILRSSSKQNVREPSYSAPCDNFRANAFKKDRCMGCGNSKQSHDAADAVSETNSNIENSSAPITKSAFKAESHQPTQIPLNAFNFRRK